jgi:adenylate cyclase class 2
LVSPEHCKKAFPLFKTNWASILHYMPGKREVEIKFRIESIPRLMEELQAAGFQQVTGRTHEMNTLYDLPGGRLRRGGALLRIRKYGDKWTVTYKDRSAAGTSHHKIRREIETAVGDGSALTGIFEALGFKACFAYEKFRSEWTDTPGSADLALKGDESGHDSSRNRLSGHVVIDETPIGDFGEIEGPPDWIDSVARRLGISRDRYITASYAELFLQWRERTGSRVGQMLFPL